MVWLSVQSRSRRWRALVVGTAVLVALLAVALRSGAAEGAEGDGCTPVCVILIQVDGLEPKDVTQTTTPYLWALAHPPAQGPPGLAGRSGWIWQAPRGVVSTGAAPATASLLSGAYPEKTGVPANDFYAQSNPQDAKLERRRLGAGGFGDSPEADVGHDKAEQPIGDLPIDTPVGLLRDGGSLAGVFLGDPGLAKIAAIGGENNGPNWYPSADSGSSQFTGDPRLCPVPRYLDTSSSAYNPASCPANDMTTASKAAEDLGLSQNSGVGFTFIHLAELGAAKRLAGLPRPAGTDASPSPPTPSQALVNTDAAIGAFVEQYARTPTSSWNRTVLMVVGTHGYQSTPPSNRVPDPAAPSDITRDLSDFVADFAKPADGVEKGSLRLVPQGTMATIYYGLDGKGAAAARDNALAAIKRELEGSALEVACATRSSATPCIDRVYYVDKNTPNTPDTLDAKDNHPTWHLDHRVGDRRSGASGDLVVTLGRGWAVGRAVGVPYQAGVTTGRPATNPNTSSSGGPQERAVAALVNGPGQVVRNLDTFSGSATGVNQVKYYPVSDRHEDPSDPNNPPPIRASTPCPDTASDPGGLACANDPAEVGDDADDDGSNGTKGHEAQPETVDFALTISALMRLPFENHIDQLQGRPLQEAFVTKLSPPCVSDCDDPPPPTCFDVSAITLAGQPVPVALSCVDERDAPLSYTVVSGPAHGTLGPVQDDAMTYTSAPGFSGTDTFTYQATSASGTSEVATATIIVVEPPVVVRPPGFDFHGLIRELRARVVDSRNRTYAQAPRGARMSTIRLEADFGKPETAVTLTFYRRAVAPRRRGRTRVVRLKAIARFDPFVVKRGHVTMRLKIPPQFRPTYVGVTVREVARTASGRRQLAGGAPCTRLRTFRPVRFRCTGPTAGSILSIRDAGRLHKPKVGGRAPRRRR